MASRRRAAIRGKATPIDPQQPPSALPRSSECKFDRHSPMSLLPRWCVSGSLEQRKISLAPGISLVWYATDGTVLPCLIPAFLFPIVVMLFFDFGYPAALIFMLSRSAVDSVNLNLCGQYDYYNSTTVPYAFNNNAWGNTTATASGYQCLDIVDGGKNFSVTYKWTGDAGYVKSYPYMKAHPSNLPVPLWNISQLILSGSWSTYVSSTKGQSSLQQAQAFDAVALRSNVAIDMFLSDNSTNSTLNGPPIEIMIWPWWIPSVRPLGWTESTPDIDTVAIAGTNFSLYHGWNAGGQHVFSWLARQNLTSTNADYSPLLKYIWKKGLLSGALWVGQLEFGTEILFAAEETRFEASNMTLRFIRQGDKDDITTASTPTSTSKPTTTNTASSSVSATATARSLAPYIAPNSWFFVVLLAISQICA